MLALEKNHWGRSETMAIVSVVKQIIERDVLVLERKKKLVPLELVPVPLEVDQKEKLRGELELEFSLCKWMQEEFDTAQAKENFLTVRMRFPIISTKKWRNRFLYIKRQHIMTREGHPFSLKHYIDQWLLQDGRCMICPKKSISLAPLAINIKQKITVIDHNHVTNIFRALLCTCCNLFIGKAKESKRRLARAIEYLEEYGHYELGEDDEDDGDETEIENENVHPQTPSIITLNTSLTPEPQNLNPTNSPNYLTLAAPTPLSQQNFIIDNRAVSGVPYWWYYSNYGFYQNSN